jgi:hypothetical protein
MAMFELKPDGVRRCSFASTPYVNAEREAAFKWPGFV